MASRAKFKNYQGTIDYRGVVDKCRLHNKARDVADSVDGIVVGESILDGEQIRVVIGADLADMHWGDGRKAC